MKEGGGSIMSTSIGSVSRGFSTYVGGEDAEGHKKTGKTADFSGLVAEA